MTPERWREVKAVLGAALERPTGERLAFVAHACGEDAALRAEVEALLAADHTDGFLEAGAAPRDNAAGVASDGGLVRDDESVGEAALAARDAALHARLAGALAGRYALERELGGGGMSRVFVATETALGRRVVVKVLPPELAGEVSAERFKREISLAARLRHPHVVPVLAAGDADGLLYYTMPFVEGESLRQRLARDGRLPLGEAVQVVRGAADALAYAHEQGVVHRDIKPENLLLERGHAVVADFGIAKALQAAARDGAGATRPETLTSAGFAVGTPAYMAPEQAVGDAATDHRADLYALGVVAYELLAGAAPFAGRTPQSLVAAHLTEPPPPLAERRPDVPPALAALIMRLLAKQPDDRPQSAGEIVRALDALRLTDSAPPEAAGAQAATPRTGASRGPRRSAFLAGAALATLALVGTAVAVRQRAPAAAPVSASAAARSAAPPPAAPTVAVLPFRVAAPELGVWREGLVDLVSLNLDGAAGLRRVDPAALLGRWHRDVGTDGAAVEGERALAVARGAGARYAILGSVVGGGRGVRLTAEAYDLADGSRRATAAVDGAADSVPALADRLTVALLGAGLGSDSAGLAHVGAAALTGSLPALKAYLAGEQYYRRGRVTDAIAAFRRAVKADSTFVLALYRLSTAESWANSPHGCNCSDFGGYYRQAVRHAQRLPERERLLVRGFAQMHDHDVAAVATFDTLVARHPDDVEAWAQLGEAYYHLGSAALYPRDRYAAAFRQALRLDSAFAPAYAHLIEDAFERLDTADARALVRRLDAIDAGSPRAQGARIAEQLAFGDSAARRRAAAMLDTAPTLAVLTAKHALYAVPDLWEPAARAASSLATQARHAPERRGQGYGGLVQIYVQRGRLRDARAALRDARRLDAQLPGYARGVDALEVVLQLFDFPPGPDGARAAAALAEVRDDPGLVGFSALLALKSGAPALALRAASEFDSLARSEAARGDSFWARYDEAAAALLRRLGGARAGDLATAEAALRDAVARLPGDDMFGLPYLRYALGKTLLARGRPREALAYFRSLDATNTWYGLAPSELYAGRSAEAAGDTAAALHHYGRFARWWRDCDPELRPWRDEALGALRRLRRPAPGARAPSDSR